jgi:hypothetical protein
MRRLPWLLAALVLVVVITAGCGSGSAGNSTAASGGSGAATYGGNSSIDSAHAKAVKFAECMRNNGVGGFPDPTASGSFTIDSVANGSSVDTSSAAFARALSACRSLEPAGFTGSTRTAQQQQAALKFAQCMRDNGVPNFPDPTPSGPIIDVKGAHSIPGFQAALQKCSAVYASGMGIQSR